MIPAPLQVTVLEETESTNSALKALARAGAPAGTVLVARRQTGGRGRTGKRFFSPEGGLYLSLLLRSKATGVKLTSITAAAAVAVCRVLEKHGVSDARIKWVNDIFLRDRKVCGILAESALRPDGSPDWVVLGAGLNLVPPADGWPAELSQLAGSVFDAVTPGLREAICRDLLTALWEACCDPDAPEILAEYRAGNLIPGRTVTVLRDGFPRQAEALYIDDDYRLAVRFLDGSMSLLDSGTVSLTL